MAARLFVILRQTMLRAFKTDARILASNNVSELTGRLKPRVRILVILILQNPAVD